MPAIHNGPGSSCISWEPRYCNFLLCHVHRAAFVLVSQDEALQYTPTTSSRKEEGGKVAMQLNSSLGQNFPGSSHTGVHLRLLTGHIQLEDMLRLVGFIPGSYVSPKLGDPERESMHIGRRNNVCWNIGA